MPNTLYYGDNLDILRRYIADETVDLVYLDPPFNSNRSYNVLFKEAGGAAADAQITAFDDTWHWGEASEEALREMAVGAEGLEPAPPHVVEMIQAIVSFVGRNDVTAYLVMMTQRLIELHRVLKPTGSLYLHCDPTASHYLKVVMDAVFGLSNFRNEITWKRRHGFSSAVHESNRFGNCTDIILFYAKSPSAKFTPQYNKDTPEYREYIKEFFTHVDEDGRKFQATSLTNPAYRPNLIYEYKGYKPPQNGWMISKEKMEQWDKEGRIYFPTSKDGRLRRKSYADELRGMPIQNLWDDIEQLGAHATERLGYPTQKPLALLERIIAASSNPGDLVLDPFCGCGTTVTAAQKLGRRWIGIDITHLSIALMRQRLDDMFGSAAEYVVVGQPADVASAEALFRADPYQFQYWALSLIKARPANEGKKGADRGSDGALFFADEARAKAKKVVVQVKGGHVQSSYIRDLRGVVEREGAALGFLITLEHPSRPMELEALQAGYYHSPGWNRDYPKLQIRTIEQLLAGHWFDYPQANVTLAQAERVEKKGEQGELF